MHFDGFVIPVTPLLQHSNLFPSLIFPASRANMLALLQEGNSVQ